MDSHSQQLDAKARAKVLAAGDVDAGTPERAYMGARRMQSLWRARSHDLDSWRESIEWMAPSDPKKPRAWQILPTEDHPYKTAKAFIEAEVNPDYDLILFYIEHMLGLEWAKRIADNYEEGSGAPAGNRNAWSGTITKNNRYAHNDCFSDSGSVSNQRGTHKAYLLKRLSDEAVAQIGPGGKYSSIYEAARKEGIIKDRGTRLCVYADDPESAGRYFAERVDREWFEEMADAFYSSIK